LNSLLGYRSGGLTLQDSHGRFREGSRVRVFATLHRVSKDVFSFQLQLEDLDRVRSIEAKSLGSLPTPQRIIDARIQIASMSGVPERIRASSPRQVMTMKGAISKEALVDVRENFVGNKCLVNLPIFPIPTQRREIDQYQRGPHKISGGKKGGKKHSTLNYSLLFTSFVVASLAVQKQDDEVDDLKIWNWGP
jgi:hypothetical protein